MYRIIIPLLMLLTVFVLLLSGCGSSTGNPVGSAAQSAAVGKVHLSILFPPRKGRTIPQATQSILITATGDGILAGKPFRKGYDRPSAGQPQQVDADLILPLGAKSIRADARDVSAADAENFNTGNTLATAQQSITLNDANFFTPATLTLDLTAPQPVITGFSPAIVHVGDILTITGTGLDSNVADQFVRFTGYNPVTPLTATPTQITVTVPQMSLGFYTVGIFPSQGMSYDAPGLLRLIREGTLQQINWTYDDYINPTLTGTGPSFMHENGTSGDAYYFKATATLNVPNKVVYGMPNATTTAQFAVNFSATSPLWNTTTTALYDSFHYIMPQSVVPNVTSASSYAMSAVLTADSIANTVAIQATPQFTDGSKNKTVTGSSEVEALTYNWVVITGRIYDTRITAHAVYQYH